MYSRRECLNCRHYHPNPHEGWKKPEGHGEYYWRNLMRYLEDKGHVIISWHGKCWVGTTKVDVVSNYGCGEWELNEVFLQDYDDFLRVRRLKKELRDLQEKFKKVSALSRERYRKLKARK